MGGSQHTPHFELCNSHKSSDTLICMIRHRELHVNTGQDAVKCGVLLFPFVSVMLAVPHQIDHADLQCLAITEPAPPALAGRPS